MHAIYTYIYHKNQPNVGQSISLFLQLPSLHWRCFRPKNRLQGQNRVTLVAADTGSGRESTVKTRFDVCFMFGRHFDVFPKAQQFKSGEFFKQTDIFLRSETLSRFHSSKRSRLLHFRQQSIFYLKCMDVGMSLLLIVVNVWNPAHGILQTWGKNCPHQLVRLAQVWTMINSRWWVCSHFECENTMFSLLIQQEVDE